MRPFRLFLESEEEKNIKEVVAKLPKKFQKLLKGYKFKFTGGNTLDGDSEHVGVIHKDKITVAAPWHYGRCFVFLHELAHLVYEHGMASDKKKEWKELIDRTLNQQKKSQPKQVRSALSQNDEELFAMSFANAYSKHKVLTYNHPEWMNFIFKL
jgi:hypothetical protein